MCVLLSCPVIPVETVSVDFKLAYSPKFPVCVENGFGFLTVTQTLTYFRSFILTAGSLMSPHPSPTRLN